MPRMALVACLALAASACAASSDPAGDDGSSGDEAATLAKALTDAQLEAELKGTVPALTPDLATKLINDTLLPGITTKRLTLLNHFIMREGALNPTPDPAYQMEADMEALYWGSPRDLVSAPAGLGTQAFTPTWEAAQGLLRIKVSGTAKNDYKLDFVFANTPISVPLIKKGSTATQTAAIVLKAIQDKHDAIMENFSDMSPIGGNPAGSPSGIDGIEVNGAGVYIQVVVPENS